MTTKEVHKGKTPNGGVLSEIYYMDQNRKPVEKKHARIAIVRELDEKGNLVYETFAAIKR
jgi:hypothetical protein